MPSKSEIEKWVEKAQKGDEIAFEKLYDFWFEKIRRYVFFRVENHEVDDLVSDIFVKVVQNLKKYSPQKSAGFGAWIFRIAHNQVVDFYRQKHDLASLDETSDDDEPKIKILDPAPLPSEIVQKNFEKKAIHEAISKLNPAKREILELKFLHDFTNPEIAKITGKSEGNIRITQLRALREMRQFLDGA